MEKLKIGIIREGKIPPDRRVALMPEQCVELQKQYPHISFYIQPSDIRCFTNKEYLEKGLPLTEDLSHCDVLFGIKEVPIHLLIPGKSYFFFSHTLKQQPHNQKLLQTILEKKVEMIDYETLTDRMGNRLIAFGKYAGIVGTYNALLLYGKKCNCYDLKPANQCFDMSEVFTELEKVKLPPLKIVVTGMGRVGKGSTMILDKVGVKRVEPDEFLHQEFQYPVYTLLSSKDYNIRLDDSGYDRDEFYAFPEKYKSNFKRFLHLSDIFIAAAYWDPRAPKLFTREDMLKDNFKVKIIADITCDINGSVPSTLKPSTIYDPAYDYNPVNHCIEPIFSGDKNVTVMAIDNLPGELPRDASKDFGNQLITHIFPILSNHSDPEEILSRAMMTTKEGDLTPRFSYLKEYAKV